PPVLRAPTLVVVLDTIRQPFPDNEPVAPPIVADRTLASAPRLPVLLCAVWLCGCGIVAIAWGVRWRRAAAVARAASPMTRGRETAILEKLTGRAGIRGRIMLAECDGSYEPGVFGIFAPVILWPRGISERLGDDEVEAILAHEVAHVRRRDNLAAALHTLVQALFWFHPLVWWLGSRLVEERERACDQDVVRWGCEPQVYAESIIRTCEFAVEPPLACVEGVTGADLTRRIEQIMKNDHGAVLHAAGRLVLGAVTIAALAGPVALGALEPRH